MTQQVDSKEISKKMKIILQKTSWYNPLRYFINSNNFEEIFHQLIKQVEDGKRFSPTLKTLFKSFEECNLDDLKVIFVHDEPYNVSDVSDGMALSCLSNSKQEELYYFYAEMIRTQVMDTPFKETPDDLSYLSRQGVLFLNVSLTSEIGKQNKHRKIWEKFISYIFDLLFYRKESYVWVFLTSNTKDLQELINTKDVILYCEDIKEALNKRVQWNSHDIFNKINHALKQLNKNEIKWQYGKNIVK